MNNDTAKDMSAEEWDRVEMERAAASMKTAKRYGRTYRRPAAIPYGTTVEEATGKEVTRGEDGWWRTTDGNGLPLTTGELDFPVRVILERSGDRKARGNDRKARRERGRLKAKARAARTLRQVHAAEEERERSRLEALEDRDRARNGEEVAGA